jgi:hypothetical protein
MNSETDHLFSYGTLQLESVQLSIFGRRLDGKGDALIGYQVTLIPIRDEAFAAQLGEDHYRNIQFTGAGSDVVEGMVLELTAGELEEADAYEEDAGYERVRVRLRSSLEAWVYLKPSA